VWDGQSSPLLTNTLHAVVPAASFCQRLPAKKNELLLWPLMLRYAEP
jgi:hypothetical protein